MPTLVTTGQITIIDQNDAKPITAFIGASGPTQQVYTKNDSSTTYLPDWTTTPLVLTAYVYIGSTSNQAANLTDRKWSATVGGTSLGNGTTYTINTNIATVDTTPTTTYYFEGNYTDSVTGLVTKVVTSIVISVVKTGTNAVFVSIRGQNVIQEADGATKNAIAIAADLIRSSGADTSDLTYKWYDSNGSNQISAASANYGFKTTAAGTLPTASNAELNVGAPGTNNTIIIGEAAVTDLAVYKVEITDTAEAKSYTAFFTVFDATDPYDLQLVSSSGDKLQNGQGSTTIYPRVFSGSTELSPSTYQSWSFDYFFYDNNGKRAGFIDTTRTAVAAGRNVTSSTAGSANTFSVTFDGTAISVAVGDIIKLVKSDNTAEYYEVNTAGTVNTVVLRYGGFTTANNWLSWTTAPSLNAFQNGKLFVCTANGKQTKSVPATGITTSAQVQTNTQITVTGFEIDGKGTIICEANRP